MGLTEVQIQRKRLETMALDNTPERLTQEQESESLWLQIKTL